MSAEGDVYARHGHELMGFKSPVSEPVYFNIIKVTVITSERQLRCREVSWEGSLSRWIEKYPTG